MNNTPQSTAMLQGLQNQNSIAEAFIKRWDSEGKKGVLITKCGLLISKTHGFLGASPDDIITDQRKAPLGLLSSSAFKLNLVKL